jgi:phosphoenolpyruvate carboxykinase (ATP)
MKMNSVDISIKLNDLLKGQNVYTNLSVSQLVEKVLSRHEGELTATGAIRATTGKYTGRSPKDKFIVEEPSTKNKIAWGSVNQPISEDAFDRLYKKVLH